MPVLNFWAQTFRDLVLSSRCELCGEPLDGDAVCFSCRSQWCAPPYLALTRPLVYAVRNYDRGAQRVILNVKEHGHHALEPLIAAAIASACEPLLAGPSVLVPVPSRTSARRRRGADVLWAITQHSVKLLAQRGHDVQALAMLRHLRRVEDQSGLSANERRVNLHNALGVIAKSHRFFDDRRSIIVVDDLLTTGATIGEAVRALASVGEVAGGACAASTDRVFQY